MYPDPKVASLVSDNLVAVRVNALKQKDEWKRLGERFNAQWTPTVLVVDPTEKERHRIEGFLPVPDFAAQLLLGLARADFEQGRFAEAEKRYREVVEKWGDTDAAPEAQYWAGVARYKATNDGSALGDTAKAFKAKYADSTWAKKASVWGG